MKRRALTKPDDRHEILTARQRLKMARSAHAYVRGSTVRFYAWLEAAGATLPEGPPVWICGDCHIGNLGPVADARGHTSVQIRDLDQTVIGNPAHDLVRLTLSLASAARGSDLPGVTTARMVEQVVEGYVAALESDHAGDAEPPESIRATLKQALKRRWRDLARERIEDVEPTIPLGRNFWPLAAEERHALTELMRTDDVRRLATLLRSRADDAPVELVDAAYWVKGCSSLGRLRYAVLVAIGEGAHREHALIDIKEAIRAAAPRSPQARMPRDNAKRVVTGARALSPSLGERMTAGRILDRSVFVRELLPQDLKFEIEHLTQDEAVQAARYLANVVGQAHARQMDETARGHWAQELRRRRPSHLDAPSWLWSSVVELLASHEAAYLEHCRLYAAEAA